MEKLLKETIEASTINQIIKRLKGRMDIVLSDIVKIGKYIEESPKAKEDHNLLETEKKELEIKVKTLEEALDEIVPTQIIHNKANNHNLDLKISEPYQNKVLNSSTNPSQHTEYIDTEILLVNFREYLRTTPETNMELTEKLKVCPQTLVNWTNGKARPQKKYIERIREFMEERKNKIV